MSRKNLLRNFKFSFAMPFNMRQRRLAAARTPMSREEFIEQVASTEIGKAAAAMFWEKLHEDNWICSEISDVFSPHPDDNLQKVYGIAEEELDEDIILEFIQKLDIEVPSKEVVNKIYPIETPRDLIKFIEVIAIQQSPLVNPDFEGGVGRPDNGWAQSPFSVSQATWHVARQTTVRLILAGLVGGLIAWAGVKLALFG